MSDIERFEIPSDGVGCLQVHILDDDDLNYYLQKSREADYKVIHGYYVGANHYMNYYGVAFDVYQIVPEDWPQNIKLLGLP